MTEFGSNGSVISPAPQKTGYEIATAQKLKRIGLASFLCGVAACISVAIIGLLLTFIYYQVLSVFFSQPDTILSSGGFMGGAAMATIMAAMNWYFGYFTIPAAWLVLGLSLGRFPRRGIINPRPYLKWGAIWGAILVGGTTTTAVAILGSEAIAPVFGALFTGALIGASAGLTCGWLFLAIVRPAEQVRRLEVDVF